MQILAVALAILIFLVAIVLISAYVCYRLTFFVQAKCKNDVFSLPDTEQYAPYKEKSHKMIADALKIPYEGIRAISFDGLQLFAKLYLTDENAPFEIMFHGYKSAAEKDFSGGVKIALNGGFNVLLVDQRAHGKSGGKALSFGVNERFDCLTWINYVLARFGADKKIFLYGMSMGAATVLMATELNLPENVIGVVTDCGYTSPAEIIKKVLNDRKFPIFPTYNLIRLGGKLFGGFDIESASAKNALKNCKIPVLFIHGGDDRFVPCDMGRENFNACAAQNKRLLIIDGAGHGISYFLDKTAYMKAISDFLSDVLGKKVNLTAL